MIGQNNDVLASATFFTSAFEFTWDDARSQPLLTMKSSFAGDDNVFDVVRGVLPDLFCSSRPALHRARWKDLWQTKPTSTAVLEQAVAKLMEQAFWAVTAEPGCSKNPVEPLPEILSEGWDSDSGAQSPTVQGKTQKRKSKQRKKFGQSQILVASKEGPAVPTSAGRNEEQAADHANQVLKDEIVEAERVVTLSTSSYNTDRSHIFDDDCSTCSGASSFRLPSVESLSLSLVSSPAAKSFPYSQGDVTPESDQHVCYAWGESGRWLNRSECHPGVSSSLCVVAKNTFLDINQNPQSSSCRALSLPPRCVGEVR